MEQTLGVRIAIRHIKILKYAQNEVADFPSKQKDSSGFNLGLKLGFATLIEENIFYVTTYVTITYAGENNEVVSLMESDIQIVFSIDDMNKIANTLPDGNFEMQNEIMSSIVVEALATVRGILYVKNLGTLASRSTIPMVDIDELLKHHVLSSASADKKVTNKIKPIGQKRNAKKV